MPKTENTRKQRAAKLLEIVSRGPDFDDAFSHRYGPHQARDQYLLWVESWVVPELKRLIPELRER